MTAAGPGLKHPHKHRHHGNRVVFVVAPVFVPRYHYPAPVYYAPPPVYIEQPPPQAQAYWYYCRELRAYYPYVQTCPGAWQRVVPQPPPG